MDGAIGPLFRRFQPLESDPQCIVKLAESLFDVIEGFPDVFSKRDGAKSLATTLTEGWRVVGPILLRLDRVRVFPEALGAEKPIVLRNIGQLAYALLLWH